MQQGTLMAKKSPLPFTLNTHTTYTPKKNAKPKHLVLFADKDGNILGNLDGDYLERATALISHAQFKGALGETVSDFALAGDAPVISIIGSGEADKLGNNIAIMKDGVIVQQGQPEDILLNPANDYVRAFVENVDRSKIITASSIMETFKTKVQMGKDGPATVLRQMERYLIPFLPVVDSKNVFKGYVRESVVHREIAAKKKNIDDNIIDIPHVSVDMPVADMLPLFINQKYPLAVVDHKDRPVGFIRHSDVVAMVTGYGDDEVQTIIENANEGTK